MAPIDLSGKRIETKRQIGYHGYNSKKFGGFTGQEPKEREKMNGNAQKLIKYMDGASKRFVTPVYQRNYDWKMERRKQLYDDLVKVIRQNRKSHFFGSIVSVQSESGTTEGFLIIDGQQRLTTVSLLLLAIYHLLRGAHQHP